MARGSVRKGFFKRSRCFFYCAVVIEVQCTSIRDCTVTAAPSHRGSGGQHGKESQIEDQVSGKEDSEEDEAQNREEEVAALIDRLLKTTSHEPAMPKDGTG
ncbi:MAG: hypothetical protein QOJ96_1477 [Alphaproteobacteria bacterium]|jgi:hypothetical protein|nr:hypothetical protein [Alphaproteobacteria bacterium]